MYIYVYINNILYNIMHVNIRICVCVNICESIFFLYTHTYLYHISDICLSYPRVDDPVFRVKAIWFFYPCRQNRLLHLFPVYTRTRIACIYYCPKLFCITRCLIFSFPARGCMDLMRDTLPADLFDRNLG